MNKDSIKLNTSATVDSKKNYPVRSKEQIQPLMILVQLHSTATFLWLSLHFLIEHYEAGKLCSQIKSMK